MRNFRQAFQALRYYTMSAAKKVPNIKEQKAEWRKTMQNRLKEITSQDVEAQC